MAGSSQRFSTLDGIRGGAAVAVLLFHGGLLLDCPWMVGHGALAVDVFFALCGCGVDRAYGPRLSGIAWIDPRNPASLSRGTEQGFAGLPAQPCLGVGWPRRAFAAARLRRLYPLYLVGLLLGLAVQPITFAHLGRPVDLGSLALATLAGALLVPLVCGGDRQVFPLDGPSWSLMVEALANLGFAIWPRPRPGALAVGVGAAAAVLLAAGLGGVQLLRGGTSETLWVDVARGAFGFGCGLLISRAEARSRLSRLRGRWTAPAMLALLGVMLVPRGPADAWLDPLAVLLFCPTAVALGTVQGEPSERLRGLFTRAGALSYPLYVLHAPLLKLAADLAPAPGSGAPGMRAAAISAAMVLAVLLAAAAARRLEPASPQAPGRDTSVGGRAASTLSPKTDIMNGC